MPYLKITITQRAEGYVPGFNGDNKVEWAVLNDRSADENKRLTRDALRVLREYWEESSCPGFRFKDFAFTILPEDLLIQIDTKKLIKDDLKGGKPVMEPKIISKKLSNGELFLPNPLIFSDKCDAMDLDLELIDVMSQYLTENTHLYQLFLSDLRDWDAFRLFMIRKNATINPEFLLRTNAESIHSESSNVNESFSNEKVVDDIQDAEDELLVNDSDEYTWSIERNALVEALSAASRRVSKLLEKNDRLRGKVINLEKKSCLNDSLMFQHARTSSNSSKKKLRFHGSVIESEKVREATNMVHSTRKLSVGEATWAMELQKMKPSKMESRNDIENIATIVGTHSSGNLAMNSPEFNIVDPFAYKYSDMDSAVQDIEKDFKEKSEDADASSNESDSKSSNSQGIYPSELVFNCNYITPNEEESKHKIVSSESPTMVNLPSIDLFQNDFNNDLIIEKQPQKIIKKPSNPFIRLFKLKFNNR